MSGRQSSFKGAGYPFFPLFGRNRPVFWSVRSCEQTRRLKPLLEGVVALLKHTIDGGVHEDTGVILQHTLHFAQNGEAVSIVGDHLRQS